MVQFNKGGVLIIMDTLYLILDEGGGGADVPANSPFSVNIELKKLPVFYSITSIDDTATGLPEVIAERIGKMSCSKKGLIFRSGANATLGASKHRIIYIELRGYFNFDNVSVNEWIRRIEIRNENGVLIADNGLPWGNGSYPPDAKNRAGLSGLHAAPAVINPELETALMGDETNKERELTTDEVAALERNEDNGL